MLRSRKDITCSVVTPEVLLAMEPQTCRGIYHTPRGLNE